MYHYSTDASAASTLLPSTLPLRIYKRCRSKLERQFFFFTLGILFDIPAPSTNRDGVIPVSRSDVVTEFKSLPPKSLCDSDIKLRECAANDWRVISPPGVTRARIEEPSFWAVVASKLHVFDTVTVIASDRSSVSNWIVLQCGHGYAEVFCLSWHELPALLASVGETLPSNHKLVFDAATGWSAIRVSDGIVIERNHDSQQSCLNALLTHASLRQ